MRISAVGFTCVAVLLLFEAGVLHGQSPADTGVCSHTCLVTREFTPLEPDLLEDKYYAPNIGLVLSVDRTTGERLQLIRYRIP